MDMTAGPPCAARRLSPISAAERAGRTLSDGNITPTPAARLSTSSAGTMRCSPASCSTCENAREIDLLVTNQPNRYFLRNWREALELPQEAHPDTFDSYGNMFGAAIPITLEHAIVDGRLKSGDLLALAGFAHAGDYAAAAIIRWDSTGSA
jgi:hypothetical protein